MLWHGQSKCTQLTQDTQFLPKFKAPWKLWRNSYDNMG